MNLFSSSGDNPEETEGKSPFQSLLSEDATPEEPGWHSLFEDHLSDAKPIPEAPHEIGELNPSFPNRMVEEFSQRGYGDTCAIRCQEVILHKYGYDVDENTLVRQAIANNLYYPGQGTLPDDVGGLLKKYSIPIHQYQHANASNLMVELAQGHEVIIGANSTVLRNPFFSKITQALHISDADHALILSGIDTHDPEHMQVVVSDPSTGEAAARYPLERFVSAWSHSDFFMTATTEPPPQYLHLPEMEHFDYDSGHIEEVADMPYEEFLEHANHPDDVVHILEQYHETEDDKEYGEHTHIHPEMSTSYESERGMDTDTYHDVTEHSIGVDDDPNHSVEDYGDSSSGPYSEEDLGQDGHHADIHDW